MRMNVAKWDRWVRFVIGSLLVIWGAAGGPKWSYIGIVLIATAAWSFCPIYRLFRTGTYRPLKTNEEKPGQKAN